MCVSVIVAVVGAVIDLQASGVMTVFLEIPLDVAGLVEW
jgi:hypothetical protein